MQLYQIPAQGLSEEAIFKAFEQGRTADYDWKSGRTFSLVYYAGDKHHELLKKAHASFFAENALNPMAFQSLYRMELEVIRMAATLLGGDDKVVGTMTSGGTESILMAVKAAKGRALSKRSIKKPNIVLAETCHVAFDKAADYFGLEARYARLTPDYRVDVKDVARLCDSSTVLIVGSAPQYVQGVIDPVRALGKLAQKLKIPLHIDACVGGLMIPWLEKLGRPIPPWDFRVPGVTSISADLHKYGYAPKGASLVLYRDMSYLKHQFFVSTNWSGGVYASPSMLGTRSGANIAAAWAAMMSLGESGYLEQTRKVLQAYDTITAGVRQIPELEIVGKPETTIFSYRFREGSGLDTFALADRLEFRGWLVDRHQNPNAIHCTVMPQHAAVAEDYLTMLREEVQWVKDHPESKSQGNAAMYGMMAKVPFRAFIKSSVVEVMEQMWGADALANIGRPMSDKPKTGFVDKLVDKYGPQISSMLDAATSLRDKLPIRKRRPTQKAK